MTQKEKVLKWFEDHETINRVQAMNELYIWNLPDVIMRLRDSGVNIETIDIRGKESIYSKYRLVR